METLDPFSALLSLTSLSGYEMVTVTGLKTVGTGEACLGCVLESTVAWTTDPLLGPPQPSQVSILAPLGLSSEDLSLMVL